MQQKKKIIIILYPGLGGGRFFTMMAYFRVSRAYLCPRNRREHSRSGGGAPPPRETRSCDVADTMTSPGSDIMWVRQVRQSSFWTKLYSWCDDQMTSLCQLLEWCFLPSSSWAAVVMCKGFPCPCPCPSLFSDYLFRIQICVVPLFGTIIFNEECIWGSEAAVYKDNSFKSAQYKVLSII